MKHCGPARARPHRGFTSGLYWIMYRVVIESNAWFRLRWFLIGSLVSLITVFVVAPKRAPLAAEPTAPMVRVVPTVVPAPPSAAKTPATVAEDVPAARASDSRRAVIPTSPTPTIAPSSKVKAKADAEPPTVEGLSSVRVALAELRASPRDGRRRSKLERAIEVASASLGAGPQAAIRRCVIQAGFEGRAAVAAEHLGACVASLERAIP
jgi:hypothetical protein